MSRLYLKFARNAILYLFVIGFGLIFSTSAKAAVPNDPSFQNEKNYLDQIHAPAAWDVTTGTKNVVVAVIDTGFDTANLDITDNLWTNTKEIAGNGLDDDGNGFVDDVHGWNFVENINNVMTPVTAEDDPGAVKHGTIIAGIIGAKGNNDTSGVGVNWNVSLMPIRAIQNDGTGDYQTVTKAVNYAVENGANVISMSFVGPDPDPDLYNSLRRAYEKGIVIVAAAGNHSPQHSGNLDSRPEYPACYDVGDGSGQNWILSVGSVDGRDSISDFSNTGKCVDIFAPGENIYSTERFAPSSGYLLSFGGPWFGTSFAAPEVAGTAALLKGIHPDWDAKQVISAILSNADPIAELNPGRLTGYGRLDVLKAVSSDLAVASTSVSISSGVTPIIPQTTSVDEKRVIRSNISPPIKKPAEVHHHKSLPLSKINQSRIKAVPNWPKLVFNSLIFRNKY